jgi:hypothetical protein
LWRGRRWRKLLNILEHLPRTSAYAQALATDERLAEAIAELPEADRAVNPKWSRYHRDYSPEVEMLSAVFDRLGELIRVTGALRGAGGKSPAAAPRPVAAIEQVRKQLRIEKHRALVARVLPKSS